MSRFPSTIAPVLLVALLALTACSDDAKSPAAKPAGAQAAAKPEHANADEQAEADELGDEAEDEHGDVE